MKVKAQDLKFVQKKQKILIIKIIAAPAGYLFSYIRG